MRRAGGNKVFDVLVFNYGFKVLHRWSDPIFSGIGNKKIGSDVIEYAAYEARFFIFNQALIILGFATQKRCKSIRFPNLFFEDNGVWVNFFLELGVSN
jgi:hypothetical protein